MPAHRYTPAMVAKLEAMASRGFPATAVAVELSKMSALPVTALSVRVKGCALGLRFRRDMRYRSEVRCTVGLDTWEKLRKFACNRGLSVAQLAQLFIEIAVDEGYISKIIDEDWRRSGRKALPVSVRIGRPRRDPPPAPVVNLRSRYISPGEVEDVRTLAAQGLSARAIGRAIGRANHTIKYIAMRHGFELAKVSPGHQRSEAPK
jgi:hypothetical protein